MGYADVVLVVLQIRLVGAVIDDPRLPAGHLLQKGPHAEELQLTGFVCMNFRLIPND